MQEKLRGRQLLEHMIMLNREISYAKSQLQPHDTGHIHTAISWMEKRVKEIQNHIGDRLDASQ